jgi:hypothetical protein
MTTDESLILYAAGYDADNNYLSDVDGSWSVTGSLDGIASSGTSIEFSPSTSSTSGTIVLSSTGLTSDATGTVTVGTGVLDQITIRDGSGGSGSEVEALSLTTDETHAMYMAGYDQDNNYIRDVNVQ